MPPAIAKKSEHNLEEPMSKEEVKKYDALIGKRFIRINESTKKPWAESKEFFWMINHHFRSTVNHGAGFRVMFQIQKYHRHKTVEVSQRTIAGDEEKVKRHQPYKEMGENEQGQMELVAPGDRLIDAALFVKQFAIDKDKSDGQTLMSEASADDASPEGEESAA